MILLLCTTLLLLTCVAPIFLNKEEGVLIDTVQGCLIAFVVIAIGYALYPQPDIHYTLTFLDFNQISLTLSVQFDTLTKIMVIFILVIGFFIYHYAKIYLESDQTRLRFLSQFNLVLCSVLLLVMAANLLTAFVAWQFIGLNLYLLLNHYHSDPAANRAAKKKFVINRIGDCSFLLAILLAYHTQSADSFTAIASSSHATLICFLLFISVMTKCAQFPFHIWLIDTMETPTPVSALMHAGVINAGGILLTRVSSAIVTSPLLMYFILTIGLISAFLSIQWMNQQPDTKKKLAYSTVGQMGYMLTQCSLGAFPAAIFHLISHGFYKASLFLNAGETLKQAPQQSNITASYVNLIQAGIIALVIFIIGIEFFEGHNGHIPLLIYGFILLTLMTFILKIGTIQSSWLVRGLCYLIVTGLFFSYLYCFHFFSKLLPQYEHGNTISIVIQAILLIGIFYAQIMLWTNKATFSLLHYRDHTEVFLRRYMLNPLRIAGNVIHLRQYRHLVSFVYIAMMLYTILTFSYGFLYHSSLIKSHEEINHWFNFSFLVIGIISLVAANRCTSIKSLIIFLLLFELAFTNLAWYSDNSDIIKMGFFHILNISTILIMLALLARKRRVEDTTLTDLNRLPTRVFYLTFALLLLIGIPGTASFISEFYLLSELIHENTLFVLMYVCLIILVAIVIMHSLQLYVFNKNYANLLSKPISKYMHAFFLAVIGLNLIGGLFPALILSLF